MSGARVGRIVACSLALASAGLSAQTPDSTAAGGVGNCVLEWGAPREGGAPALRHTQDDSGEVADFFSGRTLFTCGTATMLADSAVSYETRGEVHLVGNVAYQDSLRTLESTFLTYFERADLVVADDNVRLVRKADGSTLDGPHVEFLRAVSGIDELTIATGRPHMSLHPEGDEPGAPFEVDADRAVFAGEDEARAYGDVVIFRDDMEGEADSVRLQRIAETGEMWGDPWIEAEGVRLEGDMIHFLSRDDVLEEVHAIGDGRGVGESFEVISTIIDIELANEDPERVWAHGAGLSRATSGTHNVYGDSLEFAMFEGAIDTLYAVGGALAIQGEEPQPQPGAATSPDSTALAVAADSALTVPLDSMLVTPPDSSTAVPPDSSMAMPPDSTALAPPDSASATLSDSLALASDSSLAVLSDSAGAALPDSTVPAVPDSTPAATADTTVVPPRDSVGVTGVETPPDSLAVPATVAGDSVAVPVTVAGDSAAVEGEQESEEAPVDPAAGGSVRLPPLRVDGAATWVRGDTLIAVFVRAGAPEETAGTTAPPAAIPAVPADSSLTGERTVAEGAIIPIDSLVVIDPTPPVADTAQDPVMERLIAIGNARSLFSQVRDSTRSDRESKNYMIGKRIELLFEDGEPSTVTGDEAIGIFLDPDLSTAGATGAAGSVVTTDSSGVVSDSLAAASDSTAAMGLPADTLGVPVDTLGVPPDTTGVPSDTTGVPPDTTGVPPDTTGVAVWDGRVPRQNTVFAPQRGRDHSLPGRRDPAVVQRRKSGKRE